jgi:hypothetical protein
VSFGEDVFSFSPEGTAVGSQGCKPLENGRNTSLLSPNGAAVVQNSTSLSPRWGSLLVMETVLQGLTPLATNCRPFGTENIHRD